MTNLSRCTGILFCVLVFAFTIHCEDESYFENLPDLEEMIDPHSFSYDKHSKSMVDETGKIITSKDYTKEYNEDKNDCKCEKQVDNSENQAAIFYKRLINMMLLNMNIKENDVLLVGTLDIIMSPEQMETLKNFHAQQASLREVDEILSLTIRKPNYRLDNAADFVDGLFKLFRTSFWAIWDHPEIALIPFILVMFGLMLRMIRHGHGISMFILIQVIFVCSFLMTWWHLIEEAEIKAMAEQMKFSKIPISCQPDKMTIWDKFVSFISANDDCEKYHQAMMSNPKLKVTPVHALSHLLTTVMLQPIIHMGTVVSGFVNNATDGLPWLYSWLIKCFFFLCAGIVIIMLPICLSGGFVDFGLGPLFKFGIGFHKRNGQGNTLQYETKREPVHIYLQTHGANVPAVANAPAIADAPAIAETAAIAEAPVIAKPLAIAGEPAIEQLIQFQDSKDEVERGTDADKCDTKNIVRDLPDSNSTKTMKLLNELKKHDGSGDA